MKLILCLAIIEAIYRYITQESSIAVVVTNSSETMAAPVSSLMPIEGRNVVQRPPGRVKGIEEGEQRGNLREELKENETSHQVGDLGELLKENERSQQEGNTNEGKKHNEVSWVSQSYPEKLARILWDSVFSVKK